MNGLKWRKCRKWICGISNLQTTCKSQCEEDNSRLPTNRIHCAIPCNSFGILLYAFNKTVARFYCAYFLNVFNQGTTLHCIKSHSEAIYSEQRNNQEPTTNKFNIYIANRTTVFGNSNKIIERKKKQEPKSNPHLNETNWNY